jgi:hypothetical protein
MMEDKRNKPKSNKIVRRPSVQDAVVEVNKVTRMVRVFNSCKQMIPLQMRPPGTSFYRYEQQIRLNPGQHALLPLDHLREDQIENLQKRGFIKIIYDSGSRNSKQN